jgi:N-acetylglutamate synthase-like GNAT family acetyltransferase
MVRERGGTVRRARASDAGAIAAFVSRALAGRAALDEQIVAQRLGNVGFLLAELSGNLVGLLGWQVENLIVRVTDFLIWPASERVVVGRALLTTMEQAATELQCEAALLFLPRPGAPQMVEFCRTLGYEPRIVADLPKIWQEAAHEAHVGDDEVVLIKQLRADRVVYPL